jgi:hypothetical protein
MAAVHSLKDGYFNETGVMNSAITVALSAIFYHTVMIGNGAVLSAAKVFCSQAGGFNGCIGVPEGVTNSLYVANASTLKFCSVGSVVQPTVPAIGANSTSPSIPAGQH